MHFGQGLTHASCLAGQPQACLGLHGAALVGLQQDEEVIF